MSCKQKGNLQHMKVVILIITIETIKNRPCEDTVLVLVTSQPLDETETDTKNVNVKIYLKN